MAKRHLVRREKGRAACGLPAPRSWTTDPAEVTCIGCSRTVLMADAEMAKVLKSTNQPDVHSVNRKATP